MDAAKRTMVHGWGLDVRSIFERAGGRLARVVLKPIEFLAMWRRVRRDTRALQGMSDHLLRDIGLTREEVLHGVSRRS